MAKNLAKVLKADIPRLPLRKAAEELRKKGRGRDTILAHITPREAAKLKAEGGSGTINPYTGLPEFEDGFDFSGLDFNLPTEISAPIEAGDFYYPSVQQPEIYQLPAFGEGVDQASVDATRATYGQGPYGALVGPQGLDAPYYDAQLAQAAQAYAQPVAENIPFPVSRPTDAQFAARQDLPGLNQFLAYSGPQTGAAGAGVDAINRVAAGRPGYYNDENLSDTERAAAAEKEAAQALEEEPIRLASKVPGAAGIQTPLGTLGLKEALLLGGLGLGGFNYLRSQQQAKQGAQSLQAAYDTARQQIQPAYAQAAQAIPAAYTQAAENLQQLAAPRRQEASTLYAQTQQGALGPAYQQQLDAARAAAAQSQERAGGVGAAQAQRSIEDTRQRLLASQQSYANSLFGATDPIISNAISQQLGGQVAGIQTGLQGVTQGAQLGLQGATGAQQLQLQMAQNAGTAATGMLSALAALYSGRAA